MAELCTLVRMILLYKPLTLLHVFTNTACMMLCADVQ